MESGTEQSKKRQPKAFNRRIWLRGKRGVGKPMSLIIDYLDDLPVACEIEQVVKDLLIHRYLPLALKKKDYPEAEIKVFAYESIRFFQGLIDAIKEASGIQDEPSTSPAVPTVSLVIQGEEIKHVQESSSSEDEVLLEAEDRIENGHNGRNERYREYNRYSNGHANGVNQAQNLLGL